MTAGQFTTRWTLPLMHARSARVPERQTISGGERAAAGSADAAPEMRGAAAESRRYGDPALNRKVRARARQPLTEPKPRTLPNRKWDFRSDGLAIKRQFK